MISTLQKRKEKQGKEKRILDNATLRDPPDGDA